MDVAHQRNHWEEDKEAIPMYGGPEKTLKYGHKETTSHTWMKLHSGNKMNFEKDFLTYMNKAK